jgi:hypothetical protein
MNTQTAQVILEKLKDLPSERLAEVEDFVDFLRARESERALAKAAQKLSQQEEQEAVSGEPSMSAFGMWAGRVEMADVQAYVHKLRVPRHPGE